MLLALYLRLGRGCPCKLLKRDNEIFAFLLRQMLDELALSLCTLAPNLIPERKTLHRGLKTAHAPVTRFLTPFDNLSLYQWVRTARQSARCEAQLSSEISHR